MPASLSINHRIRQCMREKRRTLSLGDRQQSAKRLFENFLALPALEQYHAIGVYLSFDGEIDTSLIIHWLFQNQKKCYLPVITTNLHNLHNQHHPIKTLQFALYAPETTLVLNQFNILEPDQQAIKCQPKPKLDLILLPLTAFNHAHYRLGMGKGFYDAYLKNNRDSVLIGLAYRFQYNNYMMTHEGDIRLDNILTD